MIDAYTFIRLTTLTLGTIWTVRGLARAWRFGRRWESRLQGWGLGREWIRRVVLRILLRATVLDPVNLGLMLVLVAVWTYRSLRLP